MVLRPYTRQKPHIICQNRLCPNKSTRFEFVERRLLDVMNDWLTQYKAQWSKRKAPDLVGHSVSIAQAALERQKSEMAELEKQKERIHDLLERGLYDEETYLERSQNLAERIAATKNALHHAEQSLIEEIKRDNAQTKIIPGIEQVLKLYDRTDETRKRKIHCSSPFWTMQCISK